MNRRHTFRRHLVVLAACAAGGVLSGCEFNPTGSGGLPSNPDDLLPFRDDVPFASLSSADRVLVYETPGVIQVQHGTSCAQSNRSGKEEVMRVQEALELPKGLDRATVIANGFRVRYLSEDHHVGGFGSAIGVIKLDGNQLTWEAGGAISDNNFDDGYEWCYAYTVLAWNSTQIRAEVDHGDTGHAFTNYRLVYGTALRPVPGYLYNPAFAGLERVAVLPRGFASAWPDGDHHILQVAYKNDGGEVFIEANKTYGNNQVPAQESQVGSGYVSWESTVVLKDNALDRKQYFLELMSGLGGADVGMVTPPFTIAPHDPDTDEGLFDTSTCVSSPYLGPLEHEKTIHSVPYEFAIPVLAGWDMRYGCDEDEQVTQMGAWIDKWSWQPGTSPGGGTLSYLAKTDLIDRDKTPTSLGRVNVKILGLRRVGTKR